MRLRTLEFDRIVDVVASLALTPLGGLRSPGLEPFTEPRAVADALNATTETTAYFERNALFPLRAGTGLDEALEVLGSSAICSTRCRCASSRTFSIRWIRRVRPFAMPPDEFPILARVVQAAANFSREVAAVRHAIEPSGDVLDRAERRSARFAISCGQSGNACDRRSISSSAGSDTSKYLQEQVVTERNGRYVLMVRAEHRGNVPGIVHGSSASGASLFLEPSATVEINNDIVELEDREREEIFRILLELTDAFRSPSRRRAGVDGGGDDPRRAAGEGAIWIARQRGLAGDCDRRPD